MNLTNEDKMLLKELCDRHAVGFEKVIRLLATVHEFELKDRRTGIYDALREIIKCDPSRSEAEK